MVSIDPGLGSCPHPRAASCGHPHSETQLPQSGGARGAGQSWSPGAQGAQELGTVGGVSACECERERASMCVYVSVQGQVKGSECEDI